MNLYLIGGLLGGLGAAGLVLAVLSAPPLRHPTLADRIAPYLADSTKASQLLLRSQPNTASALGRLTAPLIADAVKMIDRIVGGQASVRRRLDSLNSTMTVEQFRVDQVLWGATATAGGLALGLLAVLFGQTSPVTLVLLIITCAIGGVLARDSPRTSPSAPSSAPPPCTAPSPPPPDNEADGTRRHDEPLGRDTAWSAAVIQQCRAMVLRCVRTQPLSSGFSIRATHDCHQFGLGSRGQLGPVHLVTIGWRYDHSRAITDGNGRTPYQE